MKKNIFILFIICIFTLTVSAQNDTVSVADSMTTVQEPYTYDAKEVLRRDTVIKKQSWLKRAYYFADRILSPPRDPNYIDVQTYNWQAMVQVTTRFELFNISAGDELQLSAMPEWRTRIGPFFGWRFLFLGYNIDIKSLFMSGDDMDLGGSVYSSAFGLDLFYRRVGGLYKVRKLKYKGFDMTDNLRGVGFDGVNVGMTRVSFYYVCNYRHYSHQAAFSQTNRQLKSAGSLLLGAQYAHNRVTFDWEKLSHLVNTRYGDNMMAPPSYSNMKNNEYSLTCGYGYNWVFSKNWLAAGELTGAFGYLVQKEKTEYVNSNSRPGDFFKTIEDFGRKNIAFNGNLRFSVIWNNGPWFAGTQSIMFYYQYGNGRMMSRNLLGCFYVYVGCNF